MCNYPSDKHCAYVHLSYISSTVVNAVTKAMKSKRAANAEAMQMGFKTLDAARNNDLSSDLTYEGQKILNAFMGREGYPPTPTKEDFDAAGKKKLARKKRELALLKIFNFFLTLESHCNHATMPKI